MRPIRLGYFTMVSGLGWCIDLMLFSHLVHAGLMAGLANAISASTAVTIVFVLARRWIFSSHVGPLSQAIAKYVLWNVVAVTLASVGVKLIAGILGSGPWWLYQAVGGPATGLSVNAPMLAAIGAKLLLTPLTMYANFVAMGYIIERRVCLI